MWDLSSRPGIEPVPPAVKARRLNHWTAREVITPGFLASVTRASVVNGWVGEKALGWELGTLGSSYYWATGQEPIVNSPQTEGSKWGQGGVNKTPGLEENKEVGIGNKICTFKFH